MTDAQTALGVCPKCGGTWVGERTGKRGRPKEHDCPPVGTKLEFDLFDFRWMARHAFDARADRIRTLAIACPPEARRLLADMARENGRARAFLDDMKPARSRAKVRS